MANYTRENLVFFVEIYTSDKKITPLPVLPQEANLIFATLYLQMVQRPIESAYAAHIVTFLLIFQVHCWGDQNYNDR